MLKFLLYSGLSLGLCVALSAPLSAHAASANDSDEVREEAPDAEISEAEISEAEILAYVVEHVPERLDKLMGLQENNPAQYQKMLRKISRRMSSSSSSRANVSTQRRELQEKKLSFQTQASTYDSLKKKEQQALREELELQALEMFALKQEIRQLRLESLESRLDQLETEIEEREAQQEALIEAYVSEAIGETARALSPKQADGKGDCLL